MFGHDNNDKGDDVAALDQSSVKLTLQPDGVLDDSAALAPPPTPVVPSTLPFTPPQKPDGPLPANNQTVDIKGDDGDLITIKQEALKHLSPLIGHLDQTPEEKFRTTMMMIQASDDQKLVQSAFKAAKEIKDDKARAQALLDVINEINYFTQQPESDS